MEQQLVEMTRKEIVNIVCAACPSGGKIKFCNSDAEGTCIKLYLGEHPEISLVGEV